MVRMQKENLSAVGQKLFECIEFDSKESLLYEVRKHRFGLFGIYFGGSFVSLVLLALSMGAVAYSNGDALGIGVDLTSVKPLLVLVGFLLVLFSLIATGIAAYLYTNNVLLLTSEKIAQFLYPSLFNRKISQLNIGDIQDVTVTQVGIFPRLFNYGTIVIETSGEQDNYIFSFAPNPYIASKAIISAHEEYIHQYGN